MPWSKEDIQWPDWTPVRHCSQGWEHRQHPKEQGRIESYPKTCETVEDIADSAAS